MAYSKGPKAETLYHSSFTELGWVEVTFDSDIMPPKTRGKSPFVFLVIKGDKFIYFAENDQCATQLTGLKGQTRVLRAVGSREDADIEFEGEQGGDTPQAHANVQAARQRSAATPTQHPGYPAPQRRPFTGPSNAADPSQPPPAREPAPPPARPEPPIARDPNDGIIEAKRTLGQQANLLLLSMDAVLSAFERFERKHPERQTLLTADLFKMFLSGMGVENGKCFLSSKLPHGSMPNYLPAQPTQPSDNDGALGGGQ